MLKPEHWRSFVNTALHRIQAETELLKMMLRTVVCIEKTFEGQTEAFLASSDDIIDKGGFMIMVTLPYMAQSATKYLTFHK